MVRRRRESEGGMSEKKGELVLGFYRDENGDVSFSGAEMLDAKGWLAVMASATRFLGLGFHALRQDLPRVKVDQMICQMIEWIFTIVNLGPEDTKTDDEDDEGEEK